MPKNPKPGVWYFRLDNLKKPGVLKLKGKPGKTFNSELKSLKKLCQT